MKMWFVLQVFRFLNLSIKVMDRTLNKLKLAFEGNNKVEPAAKSS